MNQNSTLIAVAISCTATAFIAGRIIGEEPSNPDSRESHSLMRVDRTIHGGSRMGKSVSRQAHRRESQAQKAIDQIADPVSRMHAIMSLSDPSERATAWLRFVKSLELEEIARVADGFHAQHPGQIGQAEYAALVSVWAEQDPRAALEYHQGNKYRPKAIQTILATWATFDADAAFQYTQQGNRSSMWGSHVIRGLASVNPDKAEQLMREMPADHYRFEAFKYLVMARLEQGPKAAQKWVMGIEDESLRTQAVVRLAKELAKTDPEAAADWLQANPVGGSQQGMVNAMREMARKDSEDAMAYYQDITDPELKRKAFSGILSELSGSNPQIALEFIESNPSIANDNSYESLAWSGNLKQADAIADALSRIQNPQNQARGYQKFMQRWLRSDFDAASAWAEQAQLPEGARQQVDQQLERHRRLRQGNPFHMRELPNGGRAFELKGDDALGLLQGQGLQLNGTSIDDLLRQNGIQLDANGIRRLDGSE